MQAFTLASWRSRPGSAALGSRMTSGHRAEREHRARGNREHRDSERELARRVAGSPKSRNPRRPIEVRGFIAGSSFAFRCGIGVVEAALGFVRCVLAGEGEVVAEVDGVDRAPRVGGARV